MPNNLTLKNIDNFISNFNSILIQSPDISSFSKKNFKIVSKKKPSAINL